MKLRISSLKMLQRKNCFRSLTRSAQRTFWELHKKSRKIGTGKTCLTWVKSPPKANHLIFGSGLPSKVQESSVVVPVRPDPLVTVTCLGAAETTKIRFFRDCSQDTWKHIFAAAGVATQPYPLWQIVRKKSLHIVSWLYLSMLAFFGLCLGIVSFYMVFMYIVHCTIVQACSSATTR